MNELLEKLKSYGADTDNAMKRFLDDADLYQTCCTAFLEDACFSELGDALLNTDYSKAFESAHTLKGVSGNLGLTPIYETTCRMVESLRKDEYSNLQAQYHKLLYHLEELKKLLL